MPDTTITECKGCNGRDKMLKKLAKRIDEQELEIQRLERLRIRAKDFVKILADAA